jgi:hypothetical protein
MYVRDLGPGSRQTKRLGQPVLPDRLFRLDLYGWLYLEDSHVGRCVWQFRGLRQRGRIADQDPTIRGTQSL